VKTNTNGVGWIRQLANGECSLSIGYCCKFDWDSQSFLGHVVDA